MRTDAQPSAGKSLHKYVVRSRLTGRRLRNVSDDGSERTGTRAESLVVGERLTSIQQSGYV